MKYLIIIALLFLGACTVDIYKTSDMMSGFGAKSSSVHPHFNDGGVFTRWYSNSTYIDALKTNKYVLIEVGRKTWPNCKRFVESVIPKFRKELSNYVAVHADADALIKEIKQFPIMGKARLLPVIIILDNKGNYVAGRWGSISETQFRAMLK